MDIPIDEEQFQKDIDAALKALDEQPIGTVAEITIELLPLFRERK